MAAIFAAFTSSRGRFTVTRPQERTVQLLEEVATGDAEPAHGAGVEGGQELPDGCVQLGEREEAAVAEGGQDPTLGHEHVGLDDGLVAWPAAAGGDDGGPVVLGELQIGAVDDGLVAAGVGDAAAEVVGHEDRGRPAKELHAGVAPGGR
jgi:hypothetical protein